MFKFYFESEDNLPENLNLKSKFKMRKQKKRIKKRESKNIKEK
jgi:hypothetical protein